MDADLKTLGSLVRMVAASTSVTSPGAGVMLAAPCHSVYRETFLHRIK